MSEQIEKLRSDVGALMVVILVLVVTNLASDISIWSDIDQLRSENAELREALQQFYDFEEI